MRFANWVATWLLGEGDAPILDATGSPAAQRCGGGF